MEGDRTPLGSRSWIRTWWTTMVGWPAKGAGHEYTVEMPDQDSDAGWVGPSHAESYWFVFIYYDL